MQTGVSVCEQRGMPQNSTPFYFCKEKFSAKNALFILNFSSVYPEIHAQKMSKCF